MGEGGKGRLQTVGSVALLMTCCWDRHSGWYCPAHHQRQTYNQVICKTLHVSR